MKLNIRLFKDQREPCLLAVQNAVMPCLELESTVSAATACGIEKNI